MAIAGAKRKMVTEEEEVAPKMVKLLDGSRVAAEGNKGKVALKVKDHKGKDGGGGDEEPVEEVPVNKDVKGKGRAVEDDEEDDDVEQDGDDEEDNEKDGEAEKGTKPTKPTHRIRKLAPPRPYPTVPTSVSATGPRSAHTEGKNYICVTRKTPLGAYLRRCKGVIVKDGFKTLHLNAMGAAIPHLLQLSLSLPAILPYPAEEVHTEILTGTVEVQDEVIPEDEDEDISYRTRGKSTVMVKITIGDGVDEGPLNGKGQARSKQKKGGGPVASVSGDNKRGGEKAKSTKKGKGKSTTHTRNQTQTKKVVVSTADMEEDS